MKVNDETIRPHTGWWLKKMCFFVNPFRGESLCVLPFHIGFKLYSISFVSARSYINYAIIM